MANDLDLDELHEAVNALMDQSKNKRAAKTAGDLHEKPTNTVDQSSQAVEVKSKRTPVEPAEAEVLDHEKIEVKRPLPNLSVGRPRGRAMDVFSPKPAVVVAPSKVKREGVMVQPANPVITEEKPAEQRKENYLPKSAEPVELISQPKLDEPEEPKAEVPDLNYQKPADNEWPDPLDVHGFKDEPKSEQPAPQAPSIVEAPQEKPELASTMTSPFLNTRVEKRPLGAYTSESAAPVKTQAPHEESNLSAAAFGQPKELSPEVVAVESAESEQTPDFAVTEPDFQDARQTTIPQQYQTTQKEANTDSRPIFDTKDYHPPIHPTHAASRSSSMGWVLIIVFAVILIAALMFAFYVMTDSLDFGVLFR